MVSKKRGKLTDDTHRIAFVSAAPLVEIVEGRKEEMKPLWIKETRQAIRDKLEKSRRKISFASTTANVYNFRKILNPGVDMLHFLGHGDDGILVFESGEHTKCGIMEPLEAKKLEEIFKAGESEEIQTKLVVISSCCSEQVGRAFVAAGVPHVVAVKEKETITSNEAAQFADLLYDALITNSGNYTMRGAFDTARTTAKTTSFVLLPEDGNHDVPIFENLVEGKLTVETPLPPWPGCKKAVPNYKGLIGLHNIVKQLVDPEVACVTIVGEHGSGRAQTAAQAGDYVRERGKIDSFHYVDCDEAVMNATSLGSRPALSGYASFGTSGNALLKDPCRMIGLAIGMPHPGPDSVQELRDYLFKNPTDETGPRCKKVLLCLENVDSFLERGGDSRDHLVGFLKRLCSGGDEDMLKLLVTSEDELQRGTDERFETGTERWETAGRLSRANSARFLIEKLPHHINRGQLGLPRYEACSDDHVLSAVQSHPVLKEVLAAADGHPGTLLRIAPQVYGRLEDDSLKDLAASIRTEFKEESSRRRKHCRSLSDASATSLSSINSMCVSSHGVSPVASPILTPSPRSTSPSPPPLPRIEPTVSNDSYFERPRNYVRSSPVGVVSRHVSANNRRQIPFEVAQRELERKEQESYPSAMSAREQRALESARDAGVDSRCLDVWVLARSMEDAADGGVNKSGRGSDECVAALRGDDHVDWVHLREVLMNHLDGKPVVRWGEGGVGSSSINSSSSSSLSQGGYGAHAAAGANEKDKHARHQMLEEEKARRWELRERSRVGRGCYWALLTTQERQLDEAQLQFIRGMLKKKEREISSGLRSRSFGGGGGGDDDAVSVTAFAKFSPWWAATVGTRSLLGGDWTCAKPLKVHGFVGKEEAEDMLMLKCGDRAGLFLLRFSESEPGALVVSYTEYDDWTERTIIVSHARLRFHNRGWYPQGCYLKYPTLGDFVRRTPELITLFPNVPKEVAFNVAYR